ncbi:hypothetical protein CHS0354_021126, partial [Potamilus streckersoni]
MQQENHLYCSKEDEQVNEQSLGYQNKDKVIVVNTDQDTFKGDIRFKLCKGMF